MLAPAHARVYIFNMLHCRAAFWRGVLARTIPLALLLASVSYASAQDIQQAGKLLLTGKYEACIQACESATNEQNQSEDWPILHAKALLAVGRYLEAETVVSNALTEFPTSVRLRVLGFETANDVGATDHAEFRIRAINALVGARMWAYRDPPNIVALGKAALLLGADAKTVLERFYDAAEKADPDLREVYLAEGNLALEKHDFALAAKTYSEALKKFPDDPDMLYGLARAYEPNERGKMLELLQSALKQNQNHVSSMLLLADDAVDAEDYSDADNWLDRALKVNPWSPEAWAYRAVLANLRNSPDAQTDARNRALHFWNTNPKVDYLIGKKLSQNYRFAEGAACQRQALKFDSDYLPAQIQLAEDLLRLGDETQGWQYAEQVHQEDGYDVTAYNLVELHHAMQKFATLTNSDFVLRMDAHEAELYGDRALDLLKRARAKLTVKYGVQLDSPTVIEIFPEQKDFGVRTFGMPLNPGFLGVCFGNVVTANSPASAAGTPENWEDVLWHEFCHVVTLHATRNKMPRWISEGISVYEERQADPSWGARMTPTFREMILGKDLTPVSKLSAAFLTPKSPMHVQFAYYESSLVVEFLINKFGLDSLKAILRDLGDGVNINDAIAKRTEPMDQIEKEFAAFAKSKAEALGPGLDWKKPASDHLPSLLSSVAKVTGQEATDDPGSGKPNYWVLMERAGKLVSEKQWQAARAPLEKLIALYPDQTGPDNAYALLAAADRGLNETNAEMLSLRKWAAQNGDALPAFKRLMELDEQRNDWQLVEKDAERFIAVNPLLPQPYRALGQADEALGDSKQAISAYQKLLLLDPADPADVHYHLARLLHETGDPAAKRQVLEALEDAPRYRAALHLLLQLVQNENDSTNATAEVKP